MQVKCYLNQLAFHTSEKPGPGDYVVLGQKTGGNPGPHSRKRGRCCMGLAWTLLQCLHNLSTSIPCVTSSQSTAWYGSNPCLITVVEIAGKPQCLTNLKFFLSQLTLQILSFLESTVRHGIGLCW